MKGDLTGDGIGIRKIIQGNCEQLYAKNLDNLEDMDTFRNIYNLPRLIMRK